MLNTGEELKNALVNVASLKNVAVLNSAVFSNRDSLKSTGPSKYVSLKLAGPLNLALSKYEFSMKRVFVKSAYPSKK